MFCVDEHDGCDEDDEACKRLAAGEQLFVVMKTSLFVDPRCLDPDRM